MARVLRDIIKIDEEKCDGCGDCIISCPEGALAIVQTENGPKARLIREDYCDAMGACIGECPRGAIEMIKAYAEAFDEEEVRKKLEMEKEEELRVSEFAAGCPSSRTMSWKTDSSSQTDGKNERAVTGESALRQWPVQLHLVSPMAPYFKNSHLLIAADCVPFAFASFHSEMLQGKSLAIACPKLDVVEPYVDKIASIIVEGNIHKVTVATMEVPCCFGLLSIVKDAVARSGKNVPVEHVIVGVRGDIK